MRSLTGVTDPASIASTIAKVAIVVLVTFSIPLQVHPCRASVDAVLRWRPNKSRSQGGSGSAAGNQPLLPSGNTPAALDTHGAPVLAMSELRFALITSGILILSYVTALNVSSLDRVLAYVGSTGSTAISFILPGLFYYKISDPEGLHHQRLSKEDDDADHSDVSDAEGAHGALENSVASLQSVASVVNTVTSWAPWRWRRRWRWDLEHLEHGLLRQLALGLSIYGVCVMVVCLVMNTFFVTKH